MSQTPSADKGSPEAPREHCSKVAVDPQGWTLLLDAPNLAQGCMTFDDEHPTSLTPTGYPFLTDRDVQAVPAEEVLRGVKGTNPDGSAARQPTQRLSEEAITVLLRRQYQSTGTKYTPENP